MRIFGRSVGKVFKYEPAAASELDDLELVADPATLRRLAAFLIEAAAEMDAEGERFDHVHLLDAWDAHGSATPDIVISRAPGAKDR